MCQANSNELATNTNPNKNWLEPESTRKLLYAQHFLLRRHRSLPDCFIQSQNQILSNFASLIFEKLTFLLRDNSRKKRIRGPHNGDIGAPIIIAATPTSLSQISLLQPPIPQLICLKWISSPSPSETFSWTAGSRKKQILRSISLSPAKQQGREKKQESKFSISKFEADIICKEKQEKPA